MAEMCSPSWRTVAGGNEGAAYLLLAEGDDLLGNNDESCVPDVLLNVDVVAGSHGIRLDHGEGALELALTLATSEGRDMAHGKHRSLEGDKGSSSLRRRKSNGLRGWENPSVEPPWKTSSSLPRFLLKSHRQEHTPGSRVPFDNTSTNG